MSLAAFHAQIDTAVHAAADAGFYTVDVPVDEDVRSLLVSRGLTQLTWNKEKKNITISWANTPVATDRERSLHTRTQSRALNAGMIRTGALMMTVGEVCQAMEGKTQGTYRLGDRARLALVRPDVLGAALLPYGITILSHDEERPHHWSSGDGAMGPYATGVTTEFYDTYTLGRTSAMAQ